MVRNENWRRHWASRIRQLRCGGAKGNQRRRPLFVETMEDRRLLTATPQGNDFRVNQVVSGTQQLSGGSDAVGIDAAGNFIVAYTGPGANRTSEIFAQRFASGGSPLGEQIRVNQYVSGSQDLAAVGVRPDGQFIVVWSGKGASDSAGIFFRQFAADGTPLGSDQRVNVTTKDGQSQPAIAIGVDGRFVVAWSGRGTGDTNGVFLRRFNADGTPGGGEVRVNKTTSATQNQPDIALAADGSLAVSWSGKGSGDSQGVFLQRFAADGSRIGDETRVNKTTAGLQERPDLVLDEGGGVIVVWNGLGPGDVAGIFSRRQTSDGTFGSESRVNTGTLGLQQNAAIAAVGDGSYFVAWSGEHFDHGRAKGWDILSQQIDVTGQRLLTELVVNTSTKGFQNSPGVGSNRAGNVVAVWSGQGQGDSAGVFARRFSAPVDHDGPVVQASLVNDTGASNSDGVTSDPTISGFVHDQSRVTKLEATFGAATGPLADVSDLLQSDGRFSFSPAQLDALAGAPLTIGSHVLQL